MDKLVATISAFAKESSFVFEMAVGLSFAFLIFYFTRVDAPKVKCTLFNLYSAPFLDLT